MKAIEAIALADALLPNGFDTELKLSWLCELEGMIYRELLSWHENAPTPPESLSEESELLVGAPYNGLYVDYLCAKIHLHNAEFEWYSNAMMRFNTTLSS